MVFMIGGVQVAQDLQRSDVPLYRLDAIDFGRRIAVEKEIEKTDGVPSPNAVFDESSNFLLYPALLGIKAKYLCLSFWQSMWFLVRM
jgi:peptidylprolyl isomerase domain and WD repeat-containing protein 1